MHLPRGKENDHRYGYVPERKSSWSWRPNPKGRVCLFCGNVIPWRYKHGMLFDSPRFWCLSDYCQRDRVHRTTVMDEYTVSRPGYAN
jgi:hypothetical protein